MGLVRDLSAADLKWRIGREEGVVTVAVSGELDLASADALSTSMSDAVDAGVGVLILDLQDLSFMDSTGLRFMLRLKQESNYAGRRFLVARVPGPVRRLLHVSGLVHWFEYVEGPPHGEALCPVCDGWIPHHATSCDHCGSAL